MPEAAKESEQLRGEVAQLRTELDRLRSATGAPLAAALDSMREGLQILDREFRYVYLNAAAARHGHRSREELLGRTMQEMYPGVEATSMWEQLNRCLRERVAHSMDNEFTYPDGTLGWFELRIEPIPEGLLVLSIDVAERRRLESQLAHAQKMEAIGRLAGGVAHDFNNLLTVISSYAELLHASASGETDREDLQQIIGATNRATQLTRQLLALGRKQALRPETVSINDSVSALAPMMSRLLGEAIQLNLSLAPTLGAVRLDPGQLDQVLLNLAANARDAMPDGGKLLIRTENVLLDSDYAAIHRHVVPGSYALLAISDTGCGMDRATLDQIFEPFFTTKGPTRGTGLGLATTHGIVRQSGGHIWVYSEVGVGTTFKLYFPHATRSSARTREEVGQPGAASSKGVETILVVDDEPAVRALCRRVLRSLGYTVLDASGPQEALLFAERYSGDIDLLLTDMVMPELAGHELFKRLRAARPGLQVLFMSGYVDHPQSNLAGFHYLEKPFTPDELGRYLRVALSGASPEDS